MRYLSLSEQQLAKYPIALLVPTIRKTDILDTYFKPRDQVDPNDVIVFDLHMTRGKKKPLISEVKEYITEELVPAMEYLDVEYVLCTQAEYFKALTGATKTEAYSGYALDSEYGDFKVLYLPNYRARFHNPEKFDKFTDQAFDALRDHQAGKYNIPGSNIIHYEEYPKTLPEIKAWLDKLLELDCPLTIDTENFSLKHYDSGLGTISFAWNQHEGIAFPVDYYPIEGAVEAPYGKCVRNDAVRALLRDFFDKLKHTAVYHNISYDVYILIYQLYMDDILDTKGLLKGLDVLLRDWHCTKQITFLATNSCAGNRLGLKDQSQEFAGNYAEDEIEDITKIPLDQLLRYNLVDSLCTWFVYDKHRPTMLEDGQERIYRDIFQPAIKDIIQMQLTGLPVDIERVAEVKNILETVRDQSLKDMQHSPIVAELIDNLNRAWVEKRNSELKVKRVTLLDADEKFNPNSNPQLQMLLFGIMGLPVLGRTESGAPSTDGDTLKNLSNHTNDPECIDVLAALRDYKAVDKLLSAFIPAFETAQLGNDGWHYLFGNFNLGGALSGRLSSSKPNLQNLPSNGSMKLSKKLMELIGDACKGYIYGDTLMLGKLIKSAVVAPPGWLFIGLDFSSLEDRISALTTKDPNKLKVYTDGFDGHCLRAYTYFSEDMPDIDPDSVESINSIEKKYKSLRQDSKAPTFAMTYQGTPITLQNNCGFSAEKANKIYDRYQEMYAVSVKWVDDQLEEATDTGYVTVAFGLRVRTPLLKQVIRGTSKTPYEAEAEGRSAGNAMGQSYCMLNSRAGSEFMEKVRSSKFALDIRPSAQIHDAQYFIARDNMETILYTNEHLVKAVEWQEDPAIAHPDVKLGGELSIFYPDWSKELELPNHATKEIVEEKIAKFVEGLD